uniref:Methyltransferase small domain-containing protein n=1 Tax=Arcella intermedia TaxID=1963864 RepID=A0A6B2L118_9EUKA
MRERRDPAKLKTETLSSVFKVSLNRKLEESNILNRVLLGFRLSDPASCLSLGAYKEVGLVTKQLSGVFPAGTLPPEFGSEGEVVGVACGLNHYMGMRGASEWEKKGIAVRALGERRIYPFYSVFAPTQQRYVQLLEEFVIRNPSLIKDGSVILDAGSGSGVLALLLATLAQKQLKKVSVVCSDMNPNAIDCIKHNARLILGDKANLVTVCCDVYPPRSNKDQKDVESKQPEKVEDVGEKEETLKESEEIEKNVGVDPSELGLKEQVVVDGNMEGLEKVELGEVEKGEEGSEEEDLLNAPLQEGNIHNVPKKKKKLLKSKKTKLKSKTKKVITKKAEKQDLEVIQKEMEEKYQLIVSNPPYLIIEDDTLKNLDIGSYDVNGAFIKKLISEANENLAEDGKMLLIYSDLGANLGLQPADLIQNLCALHNLQIEQTIRSSSNPPKELPITLPEKVEHLKKHSDYLLMVISKKV